MTVEPRPRQQPVDRAVAMELVAENTALKEQLAAASSEAARAAERGARLQVQLAELRGREERELREALDEQDEAHKQELARAGARVTTATAARDAARAGLRGLQA